MQLNGGGGSLFKILKAREMLRASHVTFCLSEAKCALSGGAPSWRPAQVLRSTASAAAIQGAFSSSQL